MPEIQIPTVVITALQVILAFGGAFLLALWLSLIIWTFKDVRLRTRDVFAILLATLMVVIFGPLGLILYFLLRPPVTLAEIYERSLEEEALLQDLEERPRCPGCSRQVRDEWVICPDCHTTLKKVCANCSKSLSLNWNLCPYCGTQVVMSDVRHDHPDDSAGQVTVEETKPVEVTSTRAEEAGATPVRGDETRPQVPEADPA